jgi:hypothetical protein
MISSISGEMAWTGCCRSPDMTDPTAGFTAISLGELSQINQQYVQLATTTGMWHGIGF